MATEVDDTRTRALPTPGAGPQMRMLAVAGIVASTTNPRKTFDQAKLQELADSIKAMHVHQPILVRPLPAARVEETSRALKHNVPAWPFATTRKREPIEYELVAGERRWRACQLAGVAEIPAMIRELTDDQALEVQIVENLQRVDVQALEEAEGINALIKHSHMTAKDVAQRIGKSVRHVYQRLQLLTLCHEVQEAMRTGGLDATKAREISYIPDPTLQQKALTYALQKEWNGEPLHSSRELASWISSNIMLRMDRARFDIASDRLHPEAGACGTCPKRTGANPDLFGSDGPDLCTDQACYRKKEALHDEAAVAKARKTGHKVITADEARGLIVPTSYEDRPNFKGFTLLDESAYGIGVIGTTARKALGSDCPETTIIIHPLTGKSMEAVKTSTAKRLISEKRQAAAAKEADKEVAKKAALPVDKRPEYRTAWLNASADAVAAKFQGADVVVPAEALRAYLIDAAGYEDEGPIGEALGLPTEFDWSEMENRLHSMPAAEVPGVFTRWLLYRAMGSTYGDVLGDSTHMLPLLAGVAGVDVREVQADVKRRMESDDRAKELEEAEKRKKPAAATNLAAQAGEGAEGGKSAKAGAKKPAARAGAKAAGEPKTSKAQASADIAAAMQALGEGSTTGSAAALQGDEAPAPAGAGPVDKAVPKLKAQDVAPAAQGNEAQPPLGGGAAVIERGALLKVKETANAKSWRGRSVIVVDVQAGGIKVRAADQPTAHAERGTFFAEDLEAPSQPAGSKPGPAIAHCTPVRVKADVRGPGGKKLKVCGRVGVVANAGGSLFVHFGPKSGDVHTGLNYEDLEVYTADPRIGSKVRVIGLKASGIRDPYLWEEGVVQACAGNGWAVNFPGRGENTYEARELEVLA
ncbi:ParB/RepB/Spo0J family partition protein [Acidovorax sp. NPDC077693]|uniref:ParB/RepB/Spo0J family partition protein n=1 Tax=unclassified Acidovorax TaxID=2684926 RepID=UPI0037CBA1AD